METVIPPLASLEATTASLEFLTARPEYTEDKPYYISHPLPPEYESRRTNLKYERHTVSAYDIRGHEHLLNIERDGIQFIKLPSVVEFSESSSDERDKIQQYLKETVCWAKDLLNANLCVAYSYVFRKATDIPNPAGVPSGTQERPDEPSNNPHIDQSEGGGFRRVSRHLTGEERAELLDSNRYRLRIINIWRPLRHKADTHPLLFCNPASIDRDEDLVAVDRVGSSYLGEVYYVRYNANQRWYWLSGMGPSEIALFVSFDSESKFQVIPHTSFHHPSPSIEAKPRESLEIRIIVANIK
ncbi:hypothetical protein K469DRAFT_746720 [Zopfia rhizophila CBS 207.26]|uniref:Methyltransferase n=1 Tax=Zopfia rhizophila CBS 207.26 TaxID=1314779 RepID=A0A6A6EK13_9PEZI|nr:hypothetical protein K469DRAFT_746720 [Zopfia rhizophila CBS 207.26]